MGSFIKLEVEMKTIFVENYDEMSKRTFEIIKEAIEINPEAVISMTTGGTPRGLFELLVEAINEGTLDVSNTTFMNLDEYVGPKDAVYTVNTFMYENFYNRIKVQPKNIFLIDGSSDNIEKEIERYTSILNEYKRDVQIVGLGTNGHIGANEPGTSFDSTIFLASHDESTIQSTMNEYGVSRKEAPNAMITLGFTEILDSKKVVLMVSGKHKAEAVKGIFEGEVTVDLPASYLRDKDNVVMVLDKDAASLLENK